MKKVRILAFVLALLMMVSLFVACDKTPDEGPDDDPAEQETVLDLVTQSVTEYVIVYDYEASAEIVSLVKTLQKAFDTYMNTAIRVEKCYSNYKEPAEKKQEKEILIGMTNREESKQALANVKYKDYVMGVYGSKIVIGSTYDGSSASAVGYFLNHYMYEIGDKYQAEEGKKFDFKFSSKDNVVKAGKYSYGSFQMNGHDLKEFNIIYSNDDKDLRESSYVPFAEELISYFNFHVGDTLNAYPSTSDKRKSECEIIIGRCDDRTSDDGLVEKLGVNGYHIELVVSDEGTKLVVLYGVNAKDAAMEAFKEFVMPSSSTTLTKNLAAGVYASAAK